MSKILQKLWSWSTDRNWKTWIGHLLYGFIIGALTLLLFASQQVAVWTVFVYFFIREVEQLLGDLMKEGPLEKKVVDRLLDWAVPTFGTAMLLYLLF